MTISDTRMRNRILIVLFVGVLMGALDLAIVAPALPAIQQAFGVNERALAWVFTAYVLFNLIGTPLMAKLSDRIGRRTVYILDVVLFAIGSLVVAMAPAFSIVLIGRAVQGFGAGGIFPVASAVIGDTFPSEKRGSALGMIGAVFGLAFLIGPIIGGILLGLFGWRSLFLINLPIAAVVIVLAWRTLPVSSPAHPAPFDFAGIATLSVLLASLAFGVNQFDTANPASSLTNIRVWLPILGALALIPVFAAIERRAADPVLRLSILGTRQARLASAIGAGAGLGESGMAFIPAMAVAALGVSQSRASYLVMPVVLAMAVGSPMVGRLLDRLGSRVVVNAGTLLMAAGLMTLGLFNTNMPLFLLGGAITGFGLAALLGAPMRYIMLNEASAQDRTAAQGALTIFSSVGLMLGGALVGAVAASAGGGADGYGHAFIAIGVVALILFVLSLGLKSRAVEQAGINAQPPEAVAAMSAASAE